MKKRTKGWLIGLGLVGLLGVGIGYWQKDNIQLVYEMSRYTQEEIQEDRVKVQEEAQRVLGQYELKNIRELTEEETLQLASGELSVDEAAKRLVEPSVEVGGVEPATNEVVLEPVEKVEETMETTTQGHKEKEIVAIYTAKMYALQSKYTGKLSGIESQGWQLLGSYSSGSQTVKQLMPQGMALVQQAVSLESACDGEVNKLLQNLNQELADIGGSTEVVGTMRSVYQSEKRARKSYYLSLIPSKKNSINSKN